MLNMRAKLRDVESMLESQKKDTLIQRQLKIAHIKYTEAQNIVLAYKMFYGEDVEIQGTIKDIQITENKICLYVACIIYGYTDAYILVVLDLSSENIESTQKLISGAQIQASGTINIKNSTVYLDKAKILV